MAQFETFSAYFSRLITIQDLIWIGLIWLLAFMLRKRFSKSLDISIRRYLLIALAFAGLIGLSLRFWVTNGTLSTFWLFAPEGWSGGFHLNANFLLNISLYVPPAILLVLARKSWWKLAIFFVALSFSIETIQQYTRIGIGDPIDWFANCLGAGLGITLGVILRHLLPRVAMAK
jgi:glycopeptide antibiotics resistance protein